MIYYARLSRFPKVFRSMTGLRVSEFEQLLDDLAPAYGRAEQKRLSRPTRQRALGGGPDFALAYRDQVLLSVIWLRLYPTHEVLAFLFGVSDSSVSRYIARLLPLLEAAGRDTMRMPDPGKKHRRELDDLLQQIPELNVVIDTFEQRVQRPRDRVAAPRGHVLQRQEEAAHTQEPGGRGRAHRRSRGPPGECARPDRRLDRVETV